MQNYVRFYIGSMAGNLPLCISVHIIMLCLYYGVVTAVSLHLYRYILTYLFGDYKFNRGL